MLAEKLVYQLNPPASHGGFLVYTYMDKTILSIPIDRIFFEQSIYPRSKPSDRTIEDYATALDLGAKFPPIKVQEVFNAPFGKGYVIIDGVHRTSAYKQLKKKAIAAQLLWPDPVDYQENLLELYLSSAEDNTAHGDRLSNADKRKVARDIAERDPDKKKTEEEIATRLKVSQKSINNWTKDIRARQSASKESIILRLSALGWTLDSIAKQTGYKDHSAISKIVKNSNFTNFHNFLKQGNTLQKALEVFGYDYPMAYSILFKGKSDQERFKELEWGLRTWDYWNFNDCDQRFGEDWPGRIPAQLVAHTMYYFTNQGDRVFDPMAGGGVVPDTCLAFDRKCNAFDLSTRENRPEIEAHYWEVGSMKWPSVKKPDLIFWDPPYYSKMEKDYEAKATNETPPISSLDRSAYLEFFKEFFSLAFENTNKGARMAFLNADWRDFQSKEATDERPEKDVTIFHYRDLLEGAGWLITHRVECPMSTQRMNGNTVKSMQNRRTLGTINRTLLIATKK